MSIATDNALATIASILAPPGSAREKAKPTQSEISAADATSAGEIKPAESEVKPAEAESSEANSAETKPAAGDTKPVTIAVKPAAQPVIEPAGYTKTGPGPMAALRFRWAVRRGEDGYYVDETVGTGSVPVVSGPMDGEAAIQFVDDRAREAQERFQALKNEMTGKGPAAPILAPGGGKT